VNDDRESYCRAVESYLCRKNDGHLIRIVGPAFEQVCSWSSRGIPLKIVYRGIDRYFDRYYAKGPRRRPVRVEFCEADVLDVFDEWRRALGITVGSTQASPLRTSGALPVHDRRRAVGVGAPGERAAESHPRASLPAHLERVVARLTALRGAERAALDATFDAIVRELDAARAGSKRLRGERREALLERLRELDRHLLEAARAAGETPLLERLGTEADAQLAPFRTRMTPDVYTQSRRLCIDRLLQEHFKFPTIAFE
jgi:hypothetical protein